MYQIKIWDEYQFTNILPKTTTTKKKNSKGIWILVSFSWWQFETWTMNKHWGNGSRFPKTGQHENGEARINEAGVSGVYVLPSQRSRSHSSSVGGSSPSCLDGPVLSPLKWTRIPRNTDVQRGLRKTTIKISFRKYTSVLEITRAYWKVQSRFIGGLAESQTTTYRTEINKV